MGNDIYLLKMAIFDYRNFYVVTKMDTLEKQFQVQVKTGDFVGIEY